MTRLVLALVVVAALLPMGAAAAPRFKLPPVTAVSASATADEVILVDEETGRRARVAVGDRCGRSYRVVDVDRERVVLRQIGGDPVYYVLPIRDEAPAATAEAPALAPIDPHSDTEVPRVLAPARARASGPLHAAGPTPNTELADPAEREADSEPPKPITATTARSMAAPREISLSRIDDALADLAALERQVSVRAERDGVRITSLESGSLVHDLGLRQGDFIRRVAGRRVDSAGAAAALYAHLARVDEVSVEVERDGDELVLRFHLVP